MNRFVIANEVKQSMTPECMDRHATLAMTGSWSVCSFGRPKQEALDTPLERGAAHKVFASQSGLAGMAIFRKI
jgi:hypothetical protein